MDEFSRHASGMLWALRFTDGVATELPAPLVDVAELPDSDWAWLHFPLADVRSANFIARLEAVPASFREMIAGGEERIQLHGDGEWAFGILPDFERDLAGECVGAARLFFACDQRRLITGRLHALRAIDDVRRAAERGQPIDHPALAIAAQVEGFVELMEDRLDALTEQLDVMEDMVLSERTDLGGQQLGPVRRELARHRRELQALRAALTRGRSGREALRAHPVSEQLNAILAQVEDVDHEFGGLQDRARLLHEEIDTLLNDATNKSMRTLTVISTLLIPPTLVVGAFGMNLPGMPFEHSKDGFMAAMLICIALVAGALYLLRRMDMLS